MTRSRRYYAADRAVQEVESACEEAYEDGYKDGTESSGGNFEHVENVALDRCIGILRAARDQTDMPFVAAEIDQVADILAGIRTARAEQALALKKKMVA